MRFKQFLESVGRTGVHTQMIDADEAVKFIKENDGAYTMLKEGKYFWRGMNDVRGAFQKGDSTKFTRIAANTSNYINLFVSTSPRWADYPKRNQSFIGTTSDSHAEDYGVAFAMFPADNAKIGKCPDFDFWQSFELLYQLTGGSVSDANSFIQRNVEGASETDAEQLRKALRNVTKEDAIKIRDNAEHEGVEWTYDKIVKFMEQWKCDNFEEAFEEALSPNGNHFEFREGGDAIDLAKINHREIWIGGEVVFVRADTLDFVKIKVME